MKSPGMSVALSMTSSADSFESFFDCPSSKAVRTRRRQSMLGTVMDKDIVARAIRQFYMYLCRKLKRSVTHGLCDKVKPTRASSLV